MVCPKCGFEQDATRECVKCGVLFGKVHESLRPMPPVSGVPAIPMQKSEDPEPGLFAMLKDRLLPFEEKVTPFIFGGRVLVYILLVIWGAKFIVTPMATNYVGESFMHNINLPFHEAGHLVFIPFGRFMTVLGGSLGQLLLPAICLGAFLFHNNAFGASAALWWFAESLMDLAPYINDARDLELMLLGGVTGKEVEGHDWEYILGHLGWLKYDHAIARDAYKLAILIMLLALIWGAYLLFRQYRNLDRT